MTKDDTLHTSHKPQARPKSRMHILGTKGIRVLLGRHSPVYLNLMFPRMIPDAFSSNPLVQAGECKIESLEIWACVDFLIVTECRILEIFSKGSNV